MRIKAPLGTRLMWELDGTPHLNNRATGSPWAVVTEAYYKVIIINVNINTTLPSLNDLTWT
jgi:hypothetical protein